MIPEIYKELLDIKGKTHGVHADLSDCEVFRVCQLVRPHLLKDTTLVRIEGPINIVGDIHGQFQDLLRIFERLGDPSDEHKYLFLGDYVDRGQNSIETICFLFCLKIMFPDNIFLLRGNHEISSVNSSYGFKEECIQMLSVDVWKSVNDTFNCLPLAAVVNDRIFCVHGGISPNIENLSQIEEVKRPLSKIEGFVEDMLWSDPVSELKEKYEENERGCGYYFGNSAAHKFLKNNNLKMIVRGHEMAEEGYDYPFSPHKKVLTVFSAPNYCDEVGNTSAVIKVTKKRHIDFEFFEPMKNIKENLSDPEIGNITERNMFELR